MFFLTVAVGTVFFIVPGIMVLMIYSLYAFLIVERRASGFQALARSAEVTSGNRIRLLGVVFVCAMLFIPGVAALYWTAPSTVESRGWPGSSPYGSWVHQRWPLASPPWPPRTGNSLKPDTEGLGWGCVTHPGTPTSRSEPNRLSALWPLSRMAGKAS